MSRLLLLVLCGCAGGTPSHNPDMAMSMMMMSNTDMAMSTTMGDKAVCDQACTTLIACGVEFGAGCSAGCQASQVFLSCAKMANPTDCNALSLCSFAQYSHDVCGGTGGLPNGTNSCNDTANCEGLCNVNMPGDPSCPCNCIAGLLPTKASSLLINNECAISKCSTECGPTGSGSACNTCAANMCASEHMQCANQ